MSHIFLSYSSKDRVVADHVYAALEQAGYSVTWDRDIPTGADWSSWITTALRTAGACVVLWTKESVRSRSVAHEAAIALEGGKLAPAIVGDLSAADFPLGLYTIQAANLTGFCGMPHAGMQNLLNAISRQLRRRVDFSQHATLGCFTPIGPGGGISASSSSLSRTRKAGPMARALAQVELAIFTFFGCLMGYVLLYANDPGRSFFSSAITEPADDVLWQNGSEPAH